MGDETVEKVMEAMIHIAWQHTIERHQLRPIITAIVARLRSSGLTDETILEMLVR